MAIEPSARSLVDASRLCATPCSQYRSNVPFAMAIHGLRFDHGDCVEEAGANPVEPDEQEPVGHCGGQAPRNRAEQNLQPMAKDQVPGHSRPEI